MLTNLNIIFLIAISVLLLAIIGLAILLFNLKKEVLALKKFNAKLYARLTGVINDVSQMHRATYGIGEKVNHITSQVKHLDARQDEMVLKEQAEKPIQQAIALAEKGATIDELIENCALSRGEAELLLRLHGQSDY